MRVSDLPTPCLLLHLPTLDANIGKLHRHINALGTHLRPHVKTCKSIDVAHRMLAGQSQGVTVSTLREARYFLDHGIKDITYAVGIAPGKLPQVAQLMRAGAELKILLDHPSTVAHVNTFAQAEGLSIPVLIEIDCDGHRAGIEPNSELLIATAKALAQGSGTELAGVLTHAGAAYDCRDTAAVIAMAEQERRAITDAAEHIRAAGLACPIVSLGSTPTAHFAEDLSGVTEVRAGVFVFQDLYQVGLGVCGMGDIAVKVLTEVIGHHHQRRQIMVDAGALALSKDRGTANQARDWGYGLAHAVDGIPEPDAPLIVANVYQEHGLITGANDPDRYPVGCRLLVLPNHVCMTAAAHERYYVTEDGDTITAEWTRIGGW